MNQKKFFLMSVVLVLGVAVATFADWSDDFSEDPPVIVATGRNNAALTQDSAAGFYIVENAGGSPAFGWDSAGYITALQALTPPRGFGYLVDVGSDAGQVAPGTYEFTADITWEVDTQSTLVDVYVLSGSWSVGFRGGPGGQSEEAIRAVISQTDDAALAMKVGSVFLPGGTSSPEGAPVDITIPDVVVNEGDRVLMFCYFYRYGEALRVNSMALTSQGAKTFAGRPQPGNGADDVIRDGLVLEWASGAFAGEHKVYFGTDFNDVNEAVDPVETLPADVTQFDPGLLVFGKSYFWRVDEVNATPDKTVYTGTVWSFEVEPEAILLDSALITAEASSAQVPVWGPNNVIDGSGLDPNGDHSTDGATMWVSAFNPAGAQITFTFDKAYKLFAMQVWNHNGLGELSGVGNSIKDVNVYTSNNGVDWDLAPGVTQLQKAPGSPDYPGESFSLAGITASQVRIDALTNWNAFGIAQFGLSEVQFSVIPTIAREMDPADGTANVDPTEVLLSWRAGREADIHQVYFSTDQQAVIDRTVAPVVTVEPNAVPALDLGQIYYWAVDEVNDFEVPSVWSSDVQSFSTVDSVVVDDMESYEDEPALWIWKAWVDGYDNGSGSVVGHGDLPETDTVYAGSQALPFEYGKDGKADSWATNSSLSLNTNQSGIKSLQLMFHGDPNATGGQLYVKINGNRHNYQGSTSDLQLEQWMPFTINLSSVGTISSMTVGVEGGAGSIVVDDIRLFPQVTELITPVVPGTENIQISYAFDGDLSDGSGNGHDGTLVGDPQFVTDPERGQVLSFDGDGDAVDVPLVSVADEVTIAAWVSPEAVGGTNANSVFMSNGWEPNCVHTRFQNGAVSMGVNPIGNVSGATVLDVNEWVYVTCTVVHTAAESIVTVYVNGIVEGSGTTAVDPEVGPRTVWIGNGKIGAWLNAGGTLQRPLTGLVDDVVIYDRALSAAEIAGLAGRTAQYYLPMY